MQSYRILLISTQDYIHHPVPSRHHYIFEELATRHSVHVPHFHVSRGPDRSTRLKVHEATIVPIQNPLMHYILNAPYHFRIIDRIVRDEKIDIVVAGHVLAGAAAIRSAKKHNVPVIFDLKDWLPDSAAEYYANTLIKMIIRKSVKWFTLRNLRKCNVIVTVSPSLVEMLKKYGLDSHLITNGVDTELFRPKDSHNAKQDLGINNSTFVIGFVGSIERWFALDVVIRALPEIIARKKDILFLIVGGALFTGYLKELEDLITSLNISNYVKFTGVIEYAKLPDYIAAMDVCLLPFSKWGEFALPNKFFEYSACGKPIVMTPVPDVLKIGGPNLFVYRDKSEFIDHIYHLMDQPVSFTINMEQFSWKAKAREFEKLFDNLL